MEMTIQDLTDTNERLSQLKREAEADRDQLEEQLARGGHMNVDEKRRYDAKIQQLEEDVEEFENKLELVNDNLRKKEAQVK